MRTPPLVARLLPAFERIVQIAALEPNWDGEGAERPSPLAYTNALQLMLKLVSQGSEDDSVWIPTTSAPIADGGLQIEWQGPDASIEVQAAPDGSFGYLIVAGTPSAREYEEADDLTLEDIPRVIRRAIAPR